MSLSYFLLVHYKPFIVENYYIRIKIITVIKEYMD